MPTASRRKATCAPTRFDGLRICGFDASNDFYLDGICDDSQYVRDLRNIEHLEVIKEPDAAQIRLGDPRSLVVTGTYSF